MFSELPEPQKISSLESSTQGGKGEIQKMRPQALNIDAVWSLGKQQVSAFDYERDGCRKAKPAISQEEGNMELRETKEETNVLKPREGYRRQWPGPGASGWGLQAPCCCPH